MGVEETDVEVYISELASVLLPRAGTENVTHPPLEHSLV